MIVLAMILLTTFKLTAENPTPGADDADLFLKWEITPDTIYTDDRTTAILYLYTQIDVRSIDFGDLKTNKKYDMTEQAFYPARQMRCVNGRRYIAIPVRVYQLTPRSSGRLTVESPEVQVITVTYRHEQRGFFYFNRPVENTITLRPVKTTIVVKPGSNPTIDSRRYPTAVAMI